MRLTFCRGVTWNGIVTLRWLQTLQLLANVDLNSGSFDSAMLTAVLTELAQLTELFLYATDEITGFESGFIRVGEVHALQRERMQRMHDDVLQPETRKLLLLLDPHARVERQEQEAERRAGARVLAQDGALPTASHGAHQTTRTSPMANSVESRDNGAGFIDGRGALDEVYSF